jgi:hypothetical protein
VLGATLAGIFISIADADPAPVFAVSASAHDGNTPQGAVDGNPATRWSCSYSIGACWIQLDLGSIMTVGAVDIAWYAGDTRSTGNGWASISEISADRITTGPLPIASISATADDGNPATNAIDGDLSTRWSCDMALGTCSVTADLGALRQIESLNTAWFRGDERQMTFHADASSGQNYTTILNATSSGTTTGHENYSVTPTLARYVRLTVTGNTSNTWASLSELEILGQSASSDAGSPDVFNITKLYPSIPGGPTWDSRHWANGQARTLSGYDPSDPSGVSQARGNSFRTFVDGAGNLSFEMSPSATEPRLYLNSPSTHFFKNVEVTVYFTFHSGLLAGGLYSDHRRRCHYSSEHPGSSP